MFGREKKQEARLAALEARVFQLEVQIMDLKTAPAVKAAPKRAAKKAQGSFNANCVLGANSKMWYSLWE